MSTDVLGWLQVIEQSSPAGLGWDEGNPAPEEALTAIAIARGLGGMEHLPLMRWTGPFPHAPGRRLVAAGVITAIGHKVTCGGEP